MVGLDGWKRLWQGPHEAEGKLGVSFLPELVACGLGKPWPPEPQFLPLLRYL